MSKLVRRQTVSPQFIHGHWPIVNPDRVQLALDCPADFGISDKSANADKQLPHRATRFDGLVEQRSAVAGFRLLTETLTVPIEDAVPGFHHIRDLLEICGERTWITLRANLN